MTTALDWPENVLGLPTVNGYGIEPQEGVARTDMDSGPARQRRRWTATPTRFPAEFRFNRYQLAIFESWYEHDGAQGANWFNITLLVGIGLVEHEARFLGQYKAVPFNSSDKANAEIWRVTTTLEVRERPMLDAGALAIALDSDLATLIATIDAFHHLVQSELPPS